MEKQLLIISKRRGHATSYRATLGSIGVSQEAKGDREKHGQELSLWFPWEGMSSFRLANLNNYPVLWNVEAVLSCLVPGCGMIKADG